MKSKLFYSLILLPISLFIQCKINSNNKNSDESIPKSSEFAINGNYISGKVVVPIGDSMESELILHVQRKENNGEHWIDKELILDDGRNPEQVFYDMKSKLQTFYRDMNQKGMHHSEIQQVLDGITGNSDESGVWVLTGLNAAGYQGALKKITCGPYTDLFTIAHESMHGWQWGSTESPINHKNSILLQDAFTNWANFVYHARINNPEKLKGVSDWGEWELDYLNYGLQNDAEWLANTFAGWLYAPEHIKGENWMTMQKSAPKFKKFFEQLWIEGLTIEESFNNSFGLNLIRHPQQIPIENIPKMTGFSEEDSEAIWKVCFNTPDKDQYKAKFDSIIKSIAPDLPGSPSEHYSLGYGDANHDGVTDWIASYTGPGPIGLGNGKYLWNRENTKGAYTFIASGKKNDSYAEYKPDPYLRLPSMSNGALAQPWFREWQGNYGSCNGAGLFKHRSKEWIEMYLNDIDLDSVSIQ